MWQKLHVSSPRPTRCHPRAAGSLIELCIVVFRCASAIVRCAPPTIFWNAASHENSSTVAGIAHDARMPHRAAVAGSGNSTRYGTIKSRSFARRFCSYKSAATAAAASSYCPPHPGRTSRSKSRASTGVSRAARTSLSRNAHNSPSAASTRRCNVTCSGAGIARHPHSLRSARTRHAPVTTSQQLSHSTPSVPTLILLDTRNLRITENRLQQHRVTRDVIHVASKLLHRIRLCRQRPELRISETSRQPPRLIRRFRQPVPHHHCQRRNLPHSRRENVLVVVSDIDQQVMLCRPDSLSRSGLVMNHAQRRRRNPRLSRERSRNRPQHIAMRRHRRLLQLLKNRLIAIGILSQSQQAFHRKLELLRLRDAVPKRLRVNTQQRNLRRRIELSVTLHAHIRTHSHIVKLHHRVSKPRPTKRATQLRIIRHRHHERTPGRVSDPLRRPARLRPIRAHQHHVRQIRHELRGPLLVNITDGHSS